MRNSINIEIFNVRGQKVKTLLNDYFTTGVYDVVWNGVDDNNRAVGSGVYFYRVQTENNVSTRRMMLLK